MNNDNTLIKSVARVMSPSGDMLGTAFIASPAGHLLTCWHVIEGFDSIKIILEDHKEPINATILKELSNPNEDIAVLQITPRKLKIVPLGIDWEPGDEVWTYGYQLQDVTTVGFPILSNILLDREVENGNQIIEISGTNFTKGFSGAPLLHKESGRIIGIVNARLSRNGVGSAIPIKTVSQSWPEINDQIQKDKQQAIDDVISLFQTLGYSIEKQKYIGDIRVDLYGEMHVGVATIRSAIYCVQSFEEISDTQINSFAHKICERLYNQKLIENAFILSVNDQPFSEKAWDLANTIGIKLVTFRELESNLINFSEYLNSYIEDYENYDKYTEPNHYPIIDQLQGRDLHKFYIDLRCTDIIQSEKEIKLSEYMETWLEDDNRRHLSIIGDYGTGKTSFSLQLVYKLAKLNQKSPIGTRIPLYFPLRDYDPRTSLSTFILEKLYQYQIMVGNYNAFEKMIQSSNILLIFDGFDELAEKTDQLTALRRFREISRLSRGKSKVILTCRTEYFKNESPSFDLLIPESMTPLMLELRRRGEYSIIEILKFNEDQILELVSRHTQNPENYWMGIKSIYNLEDLATRPILLTMILQTYEKMIDVKKKVTASDLYQIYTELWLEHDKWRGELSTEDRFNFAEQLAWQMFLQSKLTIHHDELLASIDEHFAGKYSREQIRHNLEVDIRTSTFLTRNRIGDFTFIHKSFMEFLVARKLAQEINNNQFEGLALKLVPIAIQSFLINLISMNGIKQVKAVAIEGKFSHVVRGICMDILLMRGETIKDVPWIFCVSFSPDGKQIATGSADCKIRIWNLDEINKSPLLISAHESWIRSIQYSPRGGILASSSWDGTVKIWDIANLALVQEFKLQDRITSIRFNPLGNLLAAGCYDKSIHVWDIDRAELVHVFPDHLGLVWDVHFSPDGKWIASASTDKVVRIWDLIKEELVATFRGHEDAVSSVCFSQNGKLLFSGDWQGEIIAWNCEERKMEYRLRAHENKIGEIDVSRSDNHFASSADDLKIKIWDCDSGDLVHVFSEPTNFTPNLQYNPDGSLIAVGCLDQRLRIWDVKAFKLLNDIKQKGVE